VTDILSSLTGAFTLAFVITSMFGLGLGLTVRELIGPLRNLRLLLAALVANFVILPAAAVVIARLLGLHPELGIGLILMSAVAGAPLTLKAVQLARGDIAFGVSLVVLQIVVTVVYLPLALPLLIPGVEVDAVAIAMPLILQVLLPLALGLLMHLRYEEESVMAQPIMSSVSNLSLALLLVLNLSNVGQVFGLLGTGAIFATILLIAIGAGAGWLLGGPATATRRALALGTGQRNFAAAFVLGTGNFGDQPTVMLMLLAAALISMAFTLLLAGELGRRAEVGSETGVAVPDTGLRTQPFTVGVPPP
jgi:BASS family bile acid:Na+ symporter